MRRYKTYAGSARAFLDYIWEEHIHLNREMGQEGVCSLLNLSKWELLRMGKRNFEMNCLDMLTHCRVAEVKQLLAEPENINVEMHRLVKKSAYDNQPTFNHQFRTIMKMSPLEFQYFHYHFMKTTGMHLAKFQQKGRQVYLPPDNNPTFLSNFLNEQVNKL